MTDIFGRLFTFLFGTIFLFMVPLTIVNLKLDDVRQTEIDDAVVEFVDNARASGKITDTAYRTLTTRVDSAFARCDIDILYESSEASPTPVYSDSGALTGYKSTRILLGYSKEDITDYIYYVTDDYGKVVTDGAGHKQGLTEFKDFPLKEGGYLTVRVTSRAPTPGAEMLSLFLPGYKGDAIYTSYSGYVGNTIQ